MSFWNFIGLASKKDILDMNKQLDDMKKLIDVNISSSDNINITSNKIKDNISEGFNSIKNEINQLNDTLNEEIINFRNENIKSEEVIFSKLEKIESQISKLNEDNEKYTNNLNIVLKGIYNDITELKTKTTNIETLINNKIINQITKDIKESQKQLDTLTKDMSIIQQMIRVVWVNDIIDTLEKQVSKVEAK